MYGSLVLCAQQAPSFSLAPVCPNLVRGDHYIGRYIGGYELDVEGLNHQEVSIPSRDKHLDLYLSSSADDSIKSLEAHYPNRLATLDSEYVGESWLSKLERIRRREGVPHALLVASTSKHGSFSLISHGDPIYVWGVVDPQLDSLHLVWSTDADLIHKLRAAFPLQLYFYRFPVVQDRAVFIPVQIACANMYQYCKNNNTLFAFNALELKIFREVTAWW